jgi:hypothetical protein
LALVVWLQTLFPFNCVVADEVVCLKKEMLTFGVLSTLALNFVGILLSGKGRGRQVIAVARTADLVLMMLDAAKGDMQRYVSSQMTFIHYSCIKA